MSGEIVVSIQKGTADRISELPEFILHNILIMLNTKEACRASVLSKTWFAAWSSIPVLDFRYPYVKFGYDYDDDMVERFVGFIDKIMERYITRKYRITKLYLVLPKVDGKIGPLVDKWIMIAVQNQIQKLNIYIDHGYEYTLPEILFSANSLEVLICLGIVLPFYETMELVSLKYLTRSDGTVDEDMFQRIISFCPLVELNIPYGNCLKKISLPWTKKVIGGVESRGSVTMQLNLQEYPLQKFVYRGHRKELLWQWNFNVLALKNLSEVELYCVPITDDVVSELSYGLVVLESLAISECFKLKSINISSNSLLQLRITRNSGLMEAKIDAPKLLEFFCNCELETSLSLVRAGDHCNALFCPVGPGSVNPVWFINLNKFLTKANFFKSLVIQFLWFRKIEVEHEQLMNAGIGLPYKLRELKLGGLKIWFPTKSALVAFLNGLFLCCHPDVLSMTTNLENSAVKLIFSILQEKAECLTDPLKSIEAESMEYPRLLSHSFVDVDKTRHRLSW